MTDKILVLTTAASEAEARKIAHHLVERQLAACVNLIPRIMSLYRWQGIIEQSEEYLLLIKTTAGKFTQIRQTIEELHSYQLPECISIPITQGSEAYLAWMEDSVR
jgi:periplasmic divalent cation tolerance protein